MNKKKLSYSGKKVFIGIDVHRMSYTATCLCENEKKRVHMAAEHEGLLKFIRNNFAGAQVHTAYEAGFSGFGLHRFLEKNGILNIVVNAASIEIASRDKVKTDKRDSLKIATQLSAGRLKGIYVPTEEAEQSRLDTRTRSQLLKSRQRLMNQIRMRLHQFGALKIETTGVLKISTVEGLLSEIRSAELKQSLECLLSMWKNFNIQIRIINKRIKEKGDTNKIDLTYRSIPGFGVLTARMLAVELGDLSRFPNQKSLYSFTGLTPQEYSSGEKVRRGHISRQGSSRLRHLLVEAAWRTIKKDATLRKDYETLYPRTGKKKAIVAIARRLIGRARALFRNGSLYEINTKLAA